MNSKQVIVIRKDLNMRKGKIAAQASHASMSFLTKNYTWETVSTMTDQLHYIGNVIDQNHIEEVTHWLNNSFRKICVYVDSEDELVEIYNKAIDKGMISHIVIDNGATEFNGIPTKTCVAIGPAYDSKFVGLTDELPLL